MDQKTGLVTGATSGVGKAVAEGMAAAGMRVLLVCRDRRAGLRTAAEISGRTGNRSLEILEADLSSLESVRSLARQVESACDRLHVLSNNAAVLPMQETLTADGFESVFGVNYLAHFLLTCLLVPLLERSAPARVLTVSGHPAMFRHALLSWPDLGRPATFNPIRATLQAALAKVLFALELAARLRQRGVASNTFHPGLVRSNLARNAPRVLRPFVRIAERLMSPACPTGVHLAVSGAVEGVTGEFFLAKKAVRFNADSLDDGSRERLWALSEKLSGLGG